jgi:hypothetical protein
MNTWAPLFSKIVDSSLWCEPDFVVKVFITMLAKKDADHVVRGSAFNIASWAKKTEKEVLEAFRVLSSPDKRRLEPQPFEGRRIERVEDGWLVLNGQAYQDLMRGINRKEYKRAKQAEYRERDAQKAPKESKKARERRLSFEAEERRFVKAVESGDEAQADAIVDRT